MQIQPAVGGAKPTKKTKVVNTPHDKQGVYKYDGDARIQILAPKNPKRVGCAGWKRFNFYKSSMKIKDFLKAGGKTIDLDWDRERGFIATEDRDKAGSQSKSAKATFTLK